MLSSMVVWGSFLCFQSPTLFLHLQLILKGKRAKAHDGEERREGKTADGNATDSPPSTQNAVRL